MGTLFFLAFIAWMLYVQVPATREAMRLGPVYMQKLMDDYTRREEGGKYDVRVLEIIKHDYNIHLWRLRRDFPHMDEGVFRAYSVDILNDLYYEARRKERV